MERQSTHFHMRRTLRRKLRSLGIWLLCVAIVVSTLPPPRVGQASPPPPEKGNLQAAGTSERTGLPASGLSPVAIAGQEGEVSAVNSLNLSSLELEKSKIPDTPSAQRESAQPRSVLRKATDGSPVPGIQKDDLPTSAAEAQRLGWPAVKVRPPQAPDAEVKFYPNELAQPKPASTYTRPTLKPLASTDSLTDASRLKVSPEYLQFAQTAAGLLPTSQPLYIRSTTTTTVSFSLSEDIPWLDVDLTNGTAGADPVSVLITVNTAGLSPANSPYSGDLIIANPDDPADVHQVRVRLTITDTHAASTLYSFDATGNLQRRVRPDGNIIDYDYDELGRLTSIRYPDGSAVAYTYDANGNRTTMTDARGTTVYQYDTEGRLTAVFYPGLNPVRYAYDHAGNLTSITYPDRRVMRYTYDEDGRMLSAGNGVITTTYQYDLNTGYLVTQTLPNGITTSYDYDADGRLTDVVHRKGDGSLLLAFHYTLDANGMRTSVTKETPAGSETTSYIYDDLLRLTGVTYPDGRQVDYAYDPLGNRTAMTVTAGAAVTVTTYTYDADNRLLSAAKDLAGDEIFQYGANGNLIRRTSPKRTIEYTYDYENHLVRYDDGEHVVEFEYDGDGNRVAKIVDGVRTNYINDVNGFLTQVLSEADANWYTQRAYAYGLDRIGLDQGQGDWAFYLYESPGKSVDRMVGTASSTLAVYEYEAFGTLTSLQGSLRNPFTFNGEQLDPETGLIFLHHRYYDPVIGRYLTKDNFPGWLSRPQTSNPYVFAHNDPVNFVDPTGDIALVDTLVAAGVGGTVGFLGTYAGDVVYNFSQGNGWRSFVPSSSWQTYVGNTLGGATTGALFTINPFAAGAIGGGVANGVTQGLENWTGDQQGFDVGSFGTDVALGGVFNWIGGRPFTRGPGRPPTKLTTRLLGKISQNLHWKPNTMGAALDAGWGTLARQFTNDRWVIQGGDLGGVSLNKTAQLMLEIDDIAGATYDPATGQIILFGQQDVALPEMDLDDLAVAVHSVYASQDPGVSIDPPLVNGQYSVRYEGQTRQTEFGWVMFEADRVMKILALGKDNITGQPVTSNVPGYKSMLQREIESGTCTPGTTSNRFWFQPKEVRLVRSEDGASMVFDAVSMEVLTESKFQDNVVGDPEAEAFAAHFTQHYDEFAEEWPVLKDLKRLGKIVAIIKWIKDNDIPIDLSFIDNYEIEYFSTPDNTPSITVEGESGTCHITIQGGVTYRPPNEYLTDDPVDPVTDAMRDAALSQRPAETDFLWDFQPPAQALARGLLSAQDQSLTAVAQSFTRSRKDGNVSFSEVDLSYPISGTFTLNLTRYYDSFADRPGGFGYGWQALPFQLRFPVAKQRFTFGPDNIAFDLYARIWLAERPAGREDTYELLGIDANDLPLYRRPGAMDLLRAQSDGNFRLSKVDGTLITFDAAGHVTSVTDPNGNTLQYAYGGSGRLTRIQGSGGRAIDLSYNGQGYISQASGPGGRLITYGYDGAGNLRTVTNAAGQARNYTYDADHRLVSATDAEGNPVFSSSYDDYNRTTARRAGTAADFAYDFNLAQRQTGITDPYGQQSQQRFDEQYRLTEQIDPLGNRLRIAYDGDFGPKVITDAHGVVTQLAYDQRGNLTTILDGAGGRVDLFYDWRDRLVASRDAEGMATGFGYDDNGNLTAIYHNVTLVLDENGNLTSFYYNPNNVTRFTYGPTGSLDAVTDPLGQRSQFAYGADGQLVTAGTPSGLETTFDYDARSRLSTIRSGGSQAGFNYDDADNLTGITTAAGNVGFGYDAAGNLTHLTDAEAHSTAFDYDADSNLAQVRDAVGNATSYSYDVLGNLTQVNLPNGTSTAYGYDELGRLAIAHTGLGSATPQLALVPASLDFGDVQLGSSHTLNLTLFNLGQAPLNVSAVTATPPFTPTFTGPVAVQPGGVLTVPVTFVPQDVGPATADLTVQSDDPTQPVVTVPLSGEGTLKVLNLTAAPTDNGIQLTWDPYADPGTRAFAHFNIYRSTDPIPGDVTGLAPLDQSLTDPTATTFLDISVSHGVSYYYAVTAEYTDGFEYRRVDPAGPVVYFTAFDRVGGFRSLAETTTDELRPALVYNPTADEYLLVYQRDTSGDGSNLDVIGQRVAADGSLVGGTIPIATSSQHERHPRVAYNSTDNGYLVVFEHDYNGDGSNYVVMGRRVAADGSLPANAFFVGGFIKHEFAPDVVYNPTANEYMAVFEYDYNGDGSNYVVLGRRVSTAGATIGDACFVGGYTVHERQPHIAYNNTANEYLAIFEFDNNGDGSDYHIVGQRLYPDCSKNGDLLTISAYIDVHERNPRLAYNPTTDEYLAIYDFDTNSGDVAGRRLTSAGERIGDAFYVFATSRVDRRPDVAYNSVANDFMVVWEYDYAGDESSDWDILGRRISSLGSRIGNAHFVGGRTARNEHRPTIAYNPTANEFLVAWEHDYFGDGSDFDVWAQRLGAESPQLQVAPDSLDFGGAATSLPLTITNAGTGTLDWFIASDQPWLGVSSQAGGTTGSTTVDAVISRDGLSPDVYTGTLSIRSDGGDVDVPVSMTVPNVPPNQPHTPTPSDGATGQTSAGDDLGITLSWQSSDPNGDPVTYDLYFSPDQALVATQDPTVRIGQGLTTPTFRPTGLGFLTTYHWLVVAHDGRGASTNGPVWGFTTAAVPAPQLIALAPDPTNNDRPTFGWEAVPGAARYHIQIDDDADFGSPMVSDDTLTTTSYTPSTGLPEAVLHWRVRSIDQPGQPGPFSPADSFEIDRTPPPIPTLVPVQPDRIRNRRPALSWNNIPEASGYRLQVAEDASFASLLLNLTLADTSYVPSSDLPEGDIFWRVASRDPAGNESAFSAADHFVIDVTPPPSIAGLAASSDGGSVFLTWEPLAGPPADFDHFNIYRAATAFSNVSGMTPLDSSLTDGTATAFTDTTAIHGETYYYAVTAVDTAGNENKAVSAVAATVTPASMILNGRVALERRGNQGDDRWVTQLYRESEGGIKVYQAGTTSLLGSFSATTDAGGHFSVELTGIEPGTYDISVKGASTLSNKRFNISLPSDTEIDFGTLRVGDSNGDDGVNGADVSYMVPSFLKCEGDEGFRPYADTNKDGCINGADVSALVPNFLQSGDDVTTQAIETAATTARPALAGWHSVAEESAVSLPKGRPFDGLRAPLRKRWCSFNCRLPKGLS